MEERDLGSDFERREIWKAMLQGGIWSQQDIGYYQEKLYVQEWGFHDSSVQIVDQAKAGLLHSSMETILREGYPKAGASSEKSLQPS